MAGPPRLFAIGRSGKAGGQVIQLLKDVFDRQSSLETPADGLLEGLFDVAADDENRAFPKPARKAS